MYKCLFSAAGLKLPLVCYLREYLKMSRITLKGISFTILLLIYIKRSVIGDGKFMEQKRVKSHFTQAEIIFRYVSAHIYDTFVNHTVALQVKTMPDQLNELLLKTFDVVERCSAKHACECRMKCVRTHPVIPCGSIFERLVDKVEIFTTKIKVPSLFKINVTLLGMESHTYTDDCHVTETLVVKEPKKEGIKLCGKRPVMNIYTYGNEAEVQWYNRKTLKINAFYCLTYEALSNTHVYLFESQKSDGRSLTQRCESVFTKCTHPQSLWLNESLIPSFTSVFVFGFTWIYTWYMGGEFLQTPTLEIVSLQCGPLHSTHSILSDSAGEIKVVDGPFFSHDQLFLADIFRVLFFHKCEFPFNQKSFTGSIGDLTVQATWNSGQILYVRMKFTFAEFRCQKSFCSYQEVKVLGKERIAAFSPNTTSQYAWLDITLIQPMHSFLELQDMVFYFEGLGHLPCVTGGIFIYEMTKPISLVTRICNLWTGMIWSKNGKQGAITSLHFSSQPIIIVIKSYTRAGRGHFTGYANLSPCEGIVNPMKRLLDGLEHSYNFFKIRALKKPLQFKVTHSLNCTIIQEALIDSTERWMKIKVYELRFRMLQEKNFGERLPSAYVTGCFALPIRFRQLHDYRSSKDNPVCQGLGAFIIIDTTKEPLFPIGNVELSEIYRKWGCFSYIQAFATDTWGLSIDSQCLLSGLKISILLGGRTLDNATCEDNSHNLNEWLATIPISPESAIFVPAVRCGTLKLTRKTKYYRFLFSQMSLKKSNCCYIKVSINTSMMFFNNAEVVVELAEEYRGIGKDPGSKLYVFNGTNPHYRRAFHDRLTASDNITNGECVYMHLTSNSMVVWLEAELSALETFYTADNRFSLSFTYLNLLEPIGEGAFANAGILKWNRWVCINSVETCYHALWQSRSLYSLSWETAEDTCNQKEANLLTINTEKEWHLLLYWFAGRINSLHMLRKVQLVFLGLRLSPVSDRCCTVFIVLWINIKTV